MCNEVARRISLQALRDGFTAAGVELGFPEGQPNMAPLDSIWITDCTTIVREDAAVVTGRWSWPGVSGRPVYNYRVDNRNLQAGRCLVPVDTFFEFTAPEGEAKRKTRWAFTHARERWFALGGLRRGGVTFADGTVGEAFTLLTCPPGPDIAPYHARQMVVIERRDWAGWPDGSIASVEVTRPSPAGTLAAARA